MRNKGKLLAVGLLSVIVTGALAVACGGGGEEAASTEPGAPPAQDRTVAATLFVDVDVVRGPEGMVTAEEKAAKSCVQASRIPVGGQVVWRVRVYDPTTGEAMNDTTLSSVVAVLPDGQQFAMKFGPHPRNPPGESFWTTSFKVPKDYPLGILDYRVLAQDKEGRKGEFKQILSVPAAVLTIVATDPFVSMDSVSDIGYAVGR